MEKRKIGICKYKLSPRCYEQHIVAASSYYKNLKRNNGNFKCTICSFFNSATNSNSFRFKLIKNDKFFNSIDSELKAYMLGIIAGDGNIKDNVIRIVAHSDDIETLVLFQTNISPGSEIKQYKNKKCFYISFSSSEIVKDICNILNIKPGKKSDIISIPEIPDKFLWDFLRGLVDSDGSISNLLTSKRTFPICSYASKSELIKAQLKKLCDENDINYTADKIQIIFNGKNAIKFMNKIYNNATIFLSRKFKLYELAKSWVPQKGTPFRPRKVRKDKGK